MPTNIRFKGLTATTVALNADRFQGRIAFDTTLSRFVVSPDGTTWAVMARRDVLETFAAGIQDSTLTATRVMVAGTSGRHEGFASLTFASGSGTLTAPSLVASTGNINASAGALQTAGVPRISSTGAGSLTTLGTSGLATLAQAAVSDISQTQVMVAGVGGRVTGSVGFRYAAGALDVGDGATAGTALVAVNAPDGNDSVVSLRSGANSRWALARVATTNNFAIIARTSVGGEIDRPLDIVNASAGLITIGGSTARDTLFTGATLRVGTGAAGNTSVAIDALAGASKFTRYLSGGLTRWSVGSDNTAESGSNVGSGFQVNSHTDAGVYIDTPIAVARASAGLITLGGSTNRPVNFTGAIRVGAVQAISSTRAGSLTTLSTTGLATLHSLNLSSLTASRPLWLDGSKNVTSPDAATFRASIGAIPSTGVVFGETVGAAPTPKIRIVRVTAGDQALPNGAPGDVLILVGASYSTCRITPAAGELIRYNEAGSDTILNPGDYLDINSRTPVFAVNMVDSAEAYWEILQTWA